MERPTFEVRADGDGVLWLSGELDLGSADALTQAAVAHLDGQRNVVLDCSNLTFLDSSGIRAILRFAVMVPERVVIRNPPLNVQNVLGIAGIDQSVGVKIESS